MEATYSINKRVTCLKEIEKHILRSRKVHKNSLDAFGQCDIFFQFSTSNYFILART